MDATRPALDVDTSFTLDSALLAQRKAAHERRLHTVQMPAVRAVGFAVLCAMLVLQDLRGGVSLAQPSVVLLLLGNMAYAGVSWIVLRYGHGRSGRLDLSLLFLHLDVLVWLPNLYHFEQGHPFLGCLLLVRVADQIGFGFRRTLYFNHVVLAAFVGYSVWVAMMRPGSVPWTDRLAIAGIMYLLGTYLAFTGSVTERLRRRTQIAMRTARALVESLERTTQALRRQATELERSQHRAEQANLAKGQFLAMISHEIRTPMNGILGTTELLLGSTLTPVQHRYAHTAYRSATSLLALIDDVLDLSRIEAGRLTLHPASTDLRTLVREAVDLMAATARDKPLTLGCTLAPQLPERMEVDPLRLRQLLVNLLHNAVKFTESGRVDLDVTILERDADGMRLRFAVRDTGIGIAADQLDTVFDAFTQADTSTTRRHGGSGLGLAIVREIADLMGGRVGVSSRLGVGSEFWLELKLKTGMAAPAAGEPEADVGPELSARVLLVEDDMVNQMVVEEMLKRLGCSVEVVGDGDVACRVAGRQRYDLVFMDCHMPVMDGYEATRRIRADEQLNGRRTPIVALTADALAGDRERCLAAGMDDYMTKPVSGAALAAMVERWTGRRVAAPSRW